MRQSRDETRDELFQVLDAIPNGPKAFKYNTQPTETGPIAVIENQGFQWDATDHTWPVRVYLKASVPSAEEAQQLLDEMVQLIDDACSPDYIVRGGDQLVPQLDIWQADIFVTVPRQDFLGGNTV